MVEILSSIAVRDKKQVLILRTWKRTVISELRFMPSFWGHEYRYQSDKMSLWIIHSSGASTHLKSQILRLCSQRKRLGESREFQWVVLIHWFFPFPLCPKSLKDRFLRPEFTKSSLKKVAKNGKIEASQKKEVLRWRQRNTKACASCPLKAACCIKTRASLPPRTASLIPKPSEASSTRVLIPWSSRRCTI